MFVACVCCGEIFQLIDGDIKEICQVCSKQ